MTMAHRHSRGTETETEITLSIAQGEAAKNEFSFVNVTKNKIDKREEKRVRRGEGSGPRA